VGSRSTEEARVESENAVATVLGIIKNVNILGTALTVFILDRVFRTRKALVCAHWHRRNAYHLLRFVVLPEDSAPYYIFFVMFYAIRSGLIACQQVLRQPSTLVEAPPDHLLRSVRFADQAEDEDGEFRQGEQTKFPGCTFSTEGRNGSSLALACFLTVSHQLIITVFVRPLSLTRPKEANFIMHSMAKRIVNTMLHWSRRSLYSKLAP